MQPKTTVSSVGISPQVLEAQSRLMQIRAQKGIASRPLVDAPWVEEVATPEVNWNVRNAQIALQQKRLQDRVGSAYKGKGDFELSSREPVSYTHLTLPTSDLV